MLFGGEFPMTHNMVDGWAKCEPQDGPVGPLLTNPIVTDDRNLGLGDTEPIA
jgi:hypothetical protein